VDHHYNAKSGCLQVPQLHLMLPSPHWLIVVVVFLALACKVPQKSCRSGLIFSAVHRGKNICIALGDAKATLNLPHQ